MNLRPEEISSVIKEQIKIASGALIEFVSAEVGDLVG